MAQPQQGKPKRKGLVHGTLTGYQYYGCRCVRCRGANAARAAKLRAKWRRVREQNGR